MKKAIAVVAFGVLALALPALSHAVTVCYTDSDGSFFYLNVSPGCTQTTKVAEVHGKVFFVNPEEDCGGTGHIWPVDGACLGNNALNKVVIGFRVTSEGPGCVSRSTLLSGASLSGNLTGSTRADGGSNAATTFTHTSCSNAPQ